jgi:hypothetical protein
MVATPLILASLLPLFSALLAKASPIAHGNDGMLKRYNQDTARYMQYAGCFKDDIDNRIFADRPKHDIPMDKNTVKACYEACLVEGWTAAGLQNGESTSITSSPIC